ncbi:hypothetical protein KY290_000901 [Solanum tuberosum]|uniref:Uncharacterized protein n=1 Tax=Solanum tuberosum TaxID=4113 RepID=A0ABQ7WMI7_SOLTU|nr:hypothetical protein KY290_000901 [Solanum tuberosum]
MERKHVLTPVAITKSSTTNKEVKKVKEETTNLKFDIQSRSNNSVRVFEASSDAKLKIEVKIHTNDSRGSLGAYSTPNEMNNRENKEGSKKVDSDNSIDKKREDILNEVREWLQAQKKRE